MGIQRLIVKSWRAPGTRPRPLLWGLHAPSIRPLPERSQALSQSPNSTACMMRPGQKVKSPAITSAPVNSPTMALRWSLAMTHGMDHGGREHDQCEDRQQIDRAPLTPHPQIVDPERRRGDGHHQRDPEPADGAMGQGALGCRKLHGAERECRHRRERVHLRGERCCEQRLSDMAHAPRAIMACWSAPWRP